MNEVSLSNVLYANEAWRECTEQQAEKSLKEEKTFTYLFRHEGKTSQFFFSFVSSENEIKHIQVTLDEKKEEWCFMNLCYNRIPVSKGINFLATSIFQHHDKNFSKKQEIRPLI